MKTWLNRDKIDPPPGTTLLDARQHLAKNRGECQRIEGQLADQHRRHTGRYATDAAYEAWRASAARALGILRREEVALAVWIEDRKAGDALALLRGAMGLIETIEDLDPEEAALVAKIKAFVEAEDSEVVPQDARMACAGE